jgi:hypothetical protein
VDTAPTVEADNQRLADDHDDELNGQLELVDAAARGGDPDRAARNVAMTAATIPTTKVRQIATTSGPPKVPPPTAAEHERARSWSSCGAS